MIRFIFVSLRRMSKTEAPLYLKETSKQHFSQIN